MEPTREPLTLTNVILHYMKHIACQFSDSMLDCMCTHVGDKMYYAHRETEPMICAIRIVDFPVWLMPVSSCTLWLCCAVMDFRECSMRACRCSLSHTDLHFLSVLFIF